VTYPNGTKISYALDADGNLTSQTDPTGTTKFGYDGANRQTTKTLPSGEAITAGLDKIGNVKTLADGGGTVTYGYDLANQVTSITEPGKTGPTVTYTYTYKRALQR
jgi:YD repeat-containing protein